MVGGLHTMAASWHGGAALRRLRIMARRRRGPLCLLSMSALPDQNWLCFVICVQWRGKFEPLLTLFLVPLPQPYTRAPTVLVDELREF